MIGLFDRMLRPVPCRQRSRVIDPLVAALAASPQRPTVDEVDRRAPRHRARASSGRTASPIVRRDGDEVVYVTEDAISPLWTGQRFPIRICVSGMAIQARARDRHPATSRTTAAYR